MGVWPSIKLKRLLKVLKKNGWVLDRQTSSHRIFVKPGCGNVVVSTHDGEEIGPALLSKIAKDAGLTPNDF